ncbi:MAG: hypothetical protein ACI9U2_002044, partial [Bradymonadia bacterium]
MSPVACACSLASPIANPSALHRAGGVPTPSTTQRESSILPAYR